ncbi:MAG: DMT family transporter, partial [Rhodospirillales bacterium]|nr:DMT family transporter [Rhodospirillales bacterium]
MSLREWGVLITLSIVFGGSFFFSGVAVKELPPFTIVVLRVGLAAVALHIFLRISGVNFFTYGKHWREFAGMGVLNNVIPFSLIVWGQTHIASGLASILNATTPIFTLIVAHYLVSDERMTINKMIGVFLGLGGVVIMIGPELLTGLGDDLFAQLAVLSAALCYGFASVFGRRFKRLAIPPVAVATGQVTVSAILLLPVCLWVDQPWT